jgi:hypothetical protein
VDKGYLLVVGHERVFLKAALFHLSNKIFVLYASEEANSTLICPNSAEAINVHSHDLKLILKTPGF